MHHLTKQRFGLIPNLVAALGDVRTTKQAKMVVNVDLHSRELIFIKIEMHYVIRLYMMEVRYVQPGIHG